MDLANPSTGLLVVYTILASLVAAGAVLKGVVPFVRGVRRVWRKVGGALDNIGGRDPFVDPATGLLVAGIPPIGERFTVIEKKLDSVADISQWRDTVDSRLNSHELRLEDHDTTLGLIIGTTYQKGSEAELKAVAKKNAGAVDGEST